MAVADIKKKVDEIAKRHHYKCIDYQENIGLASYYKDGTRINVYLTTMTVATCLKHPKKGHTQLFRRNVTFKELNHLFIKPRKHTGKGYYKRKKQISSPKK